MPFIGGRESYDNAAAIEPSVANIIKLYARIETPLLDRIGDSEKNATQAIHSWFRDELVPDYDTINDSGGISDSDTSLTVTNGERHLVAETIMIEDEVIYVSAVSTNTLTIARGYGGSTAAAHADGVAIRIIAHGNIEGADAGVAKSRSRSLMTNYAHVIEPAPNQVRVADQQALK